MRRAVPHGEEVVVTRNVTVPRQVVWVLEVTGTPATGVLDHADGGLWESKEKRVIAPSSTPGAVITLHFDTSTEHQLPKPLCSPRSFTGIAWPSTWDRAGRKRPDSSKAGSPQSPTDDVFQSPTLLAKSCNWTLQQFHSTGPCWDRAPKINPLMHWLYPPSQRLPVPSQVHTTCLKKGKKSSAVKPPTE